MNTLSSKEVQRTVNRPAAWSLIEMIGVMAIIAVLSLAIAPALMKQITQANKEAETKMLERLADGLQRSILREHRIPGSTDFAQAIARELGLDQASVLYNRAGQQRVCLIHPGMRIGPNGNSSLPFTQDWQGSVAPTNARVMLISSLSVPLPTGIQSGPAPSADAFENIWDTAEDNVPSGWTGWGGSGALLIIRRINLGLLFVQVALNNNSPDRGRFAIDSDTVTRQAPLTTSYLINTKLRLYRAGQDTPQTIEIVSEPVSYLYYNGVWQGSFSTNRDPRSLSGADLQAAYDLFMASPENPDGKATKTEVVSAMTDFMMLYTNWAAQNFPGSLQRDVKQAAMRLDDVLQGYLFKAAK
ncbi:MAG: type II secretion system protein [Verrucomicrobiota bacterium]|nr:type II secretion system protein [Verrucomicrobiota bacterium]